MMSSCYFIRRILCVTAISMVLSVMCFITQNQVTLRNLFLKVELDALLAENTKFEVISLAQAIRLYHAHVLFLDIRETQYFQYGHIQDAVNLPFPKIKTISDAWLSDLKNAEKIVIYCNGIQCGSAYYAAKQLMDMGLNNVVIYEAGWPEWRSCRLPMTMSPAMKQDMANEALRETAK